MLIPTLASMKARHEMRIASNGQQSPVTDRLFAEGGSGAFLPPATAAVQASEAANITVGATVYQVFIFGVDDPDDTEVDRYIP
jgi:hypothetical protein